jgi:hypothetical protein
MPSAAAYDDKVFLSMNPQVSRTKASSSTEKDTLRRKKQVLFTLAAHSPIAAAA